MEGGVGPEGEGGHHEDGGGGGGEGLGDLPMAVGFGAGDVLGDEVVVRAEGQLGAGPPSIRVAGGGMGMGHGRARGILGPDGMSIES